jgi:phosphatidylserine/phosphatidylglycerophosphate/cardiolipin synthase-like enzyme
VSLFCLWKKAGTCKSPPLYLSTRIFFFLRAFLLLAPFLWSYPCVASTPCPPALVQVLEDDRLLPAILSSVEKAQKEIWVGTYHFRAGIHPRSAPDRLAQELIKAAKRGVQVHVLMERPEDPLSEQATDNKKTASLFQRGGVKVYWDSPHRRSHMKVVVVDGRFAVVGSHNLTKGGLKDNHELSLSVDSPCLAEKVISYLKRLAKEGGNKLP